MSLPVSSASDRRRLQRPPEPERLLHERPPPRDTPAQRTAQAVDMRRAGVPAVGTTLLRPFHAVETTRLRSLLSHLLTDVESRKPCPKSRSIRPRTFSGEKTRFSTRAAHGITRANLPVRSRSNRSCAEARRGKRATADTN